MTSNPKIMPNSKEHSRNDKQSIKESSTKNSDTLDVHSIPEGSVESRDLLDKIQLGIAIFLQTTLVFAIISAIYFSRWTVLFVSSLTLLLSFIPSLIKRRYSVVLPIEFQFVMIVFLYASIFLGEVHGYYTRFWWWDVVLHTCSGIVLGFIGFLILYILANQNKLATNPFWIAVFSFCFAVALGAVWEIFEFAMDQFFGLNMQKNGLVDTMWDLIVDSLGALLTSIVGYFYIKGVKRPLFTRLLEKFFKSNPRF